MTKEAMFSPPKNYSVSSSPLTKALSIRLVRTPLKEIVSQSSPKRKRASPGEETPEKRKKRAVVERRSSRARTPVFTYDLNLSPDENITPKKTKKLSRRSLTPSVSSSQRTATRRTQSDKKKVLSPIGEGTSTPLKKNPAVRRIIQDYPGPPTPRTNRRNLRAPSVSPGKKFTLSRIDLDDLDDLDIDDSDEDTFKPVRLSDDEDDFSPQSNDKKSKRRYTPSKTRKLPSKKPSTQKKKLPSKRSSMTPKVPVRKVPLPLDVSNIQEAQLRLHVSAVPDSLPCREKEYEEIYNFTEGKIIEESGGCMYISGVPGTGKTATVKEVIRNLKSDEVIPDFTFIEINGMRLTEPNQAYAQIWKDLCPHGQNGSKITTDHAQSLLDKKFSTKSEKPIVLLVDELDMLCTSRRQNVLYNLFDWPNRSGSNLVVLAIANTMDLPERVMLNRVSSRLGLTRLTFSPYTHHQLQEIVATRLTGLEIFDKDAVQLVSRKVASLSGDARRALDICRRATEIAERRTAELVSLSDVADAHKEMFSSSKVMAIRSCSTYEKIFLRAIISEFHRTGIEETYLDRVLREFGAILHYEGLALTSLAQGVDLAYRLSSSKLIIAEHGCKALSMKIQLHASVDDVQFALT
ncbi:origin recognition complex subunit 1 [Lepeophtheirus salmonis]|uniref:origin recognition complex subunit 1 n=1 Tax=Lepeophtheirus salmonis TaxID=72036 RepID=UPI001AE46E6A|nr:origin recognition complex subunit 1-like [Lepeophtheirus salmonis]